MSPCLKMVSSAPSIFCHVWSRKALGSTLRVGLKFLTIRRLGPALTAMFGAVLRMIPFRGFAGLASGLELMSTISLPFAMLARLLGKLYMSAVLMVLVATGVAASRGSSRGGCAWSWERAEPWQSSSASAGQ